MVNGTFFALALGQELSAAILNPYSQEMMKAYYTYRALAGIDDNCTEYIDYAETAPAAVPLAEPKKNEVTPSSDECSSQLQRAVIKGLKEQAAGLTERMLVSVAPLQIVQDEIIPALNIVGVGFENKTMYLPQLLMSAEAAKAAFEVIRSKMSGEKTTNKCAFVIATVKGDIHDIGKNIVKLILENYGFPVTDLGRDADPETVVRETVRLHAPIVGLSALMTTTVPAMEETIKQLRQYAPWCKIVVGGAVLNREYAHTIGADKYAKDAMETVRYAEEINRMINSESILVI